MKSTLIRFGVPATLRAFLVLFAGAFAFGAMASRAAALEITTVTGSATTTITSLVYNADTTISIQSEQVGYLTSVGAFTAKFSYLAIPTPTTIVIVGTGTLTAANGSKIFLTASIVELGLDYPRTLNGALTITGGTGRYAGAKGSLLVNGIDEESLTDTITINGVIVLPGLPLLGLKG